MDREYAQELIGKVQLLQRICLFNQEQLPGLACFEPAAGTEQEQLFLSLRQLNPSLQLFARKSAPVFLEFGPFNERLALLSAAELQALCRCLGAARAAAALACIIQKTRLEQLFTLLPPAEYRWAMQYGRFALPPRLILSTGQVGTDFFVRLPAFGAQLLLSLNYKLQAAGTAEPITRVLAQQLLPITGQEPELQADLALQPRELEQLSALCRQVLRKLLGVDLG